MSLLKYMKDKNTWITFYVDAINNRLRRDKNLGDVLDKQVSRDNLELSGVDNETHFHDKRYLPKINQEIIDRQNADANLVGNIIQEKTDRQNADAAIANAVTNKIDIVEQKTNAIQVIFNTTNADLADRIDGVKDSVDNIGTKAVAVPGSTQAQISIQTVTGTVTNSRGWRNSPVTADYTDNIRIDNTVAGIAAGTYTLDDLLSQLVQESHSHTQNSTTRSYNCVPNCNCNCSSSH